MVDWYTYKETREYVDRALEAQKTYRELYGSDLREAATEVSVAGSLRGEA